MLSRKALRKALIVSCCLAAFIVFLALVLTPLVRMRQASFKPLNSETLAGLGIAALDKTDLSRASLVPTGASGTDASKDTNTTLSLSSGTKSRMSPRLARPPSAADAKSYWWSSVSIREWERPIMKVSLGVRKRMEAFVWLVKPDSTAEFAIQISNRSFLLGDTVTARNYFQEALRTGIQGRSRELICAQLAWLEEDPEVATALLQESCASGFSSWLLKAIDLAVLTNSDDLADYYLKRLSDVAGTENVADWLKSSSRYPEVEAWKKRHATNPPIKEKPNP